MAVVHITFREVHYGPRTLYTTRRSTYLEVNVNWRNYNSFVVIYIKWLRQSCYVFTTQLKFIARIYKINKYRYNLVKAISTHVYSVI